MTFSCFWSQVVSSRVGDIIGFQPKNRVAVNHWASNPLANFLYEQQKLTPGKIWTLDSAIKYKTIFLLLFMWVLLKQVFLSQVRRSPVHKSQWSLNYWCLKILNPILHLQGQVDDYERDMKISPLISFINHSFECLVRI